MGIRRAFLVVCMLLLRVVFCNEGSAKEIEVRILLARTQGEITCSSPGGLEVWIGRKTFTVSANHPLSFSLTPSGVLWKEKNVVVHSLVVTSRKDMVYLGKRPYRGRLEIRKKESNLEVINILPLEDYLKGTMKLETSPSWPEEALKAHIIVARTYALRNLGRHREEGFDFCSTVHCQRYGGVFAEDPRTNDLVEKTRGVILVYRGKPASVVFHSESGGYTDSAEHVWGREVPYLVEVPSPWEDGAPHNSWRVTLSSEEIAEALGKRGYIQSTVLGIRCQRSEKSGRVIKVFVDTDRGTVELTGNQFREAIGFDRLPSTMFTLESNQLEEPIQDLESAWNLGEKVNTLINYEEWMQRDWNLDDIITFLKLREKEREARKGKERTTESIRKRFVPREVSCTFTFVGRGWGHGVGLSQWGAVGMARNGASFSEILSHYFPGCELGRVVIH